MDPEDIAAQLRCPSGSDAFETAERMNAANAETNRRAIRLLGIENGNRVLEIGPANAAFVPEIVGAAQDVSYCGLDHSADMVQTARDTYADWQPPEALSFEQGSSDAVPFADAAFDRVLAVHTLYFWGQPHDHLREIRRVLKPGGRFCLAFGDRSFMQDLPFTPYGFTLYSQAAATTVLSETGFEVLRAEVHIETGPSNTGETVDKQIHILLCQNPSA